MIRPLGRDDARAQPSAIPRAAEESSRRGLVQFLTSAWFVAAGAGAMFALAAFYMHMQQQDALSDARLDAQLTAAGELRPVAEIVEAVRSLKLVTVELKTRVRKEVVSQLWRGTARAVVEAPATYFYGVDLATLDKADIRVAPTLLPPHHGSAARLSSTGEARDRQRGRQPVAYYVRISSPQRIAAEVDAAGRTEQVFVGGTRLRTRAGEHVLGLARIGLQQAAHEAALSPEDMECVRTETRRQVEECVRKFARGDVEVTVEFADEIAPAQSPSPALAGK